MAQPHIQTPSFRLDGRRALVTGGGRGLGAACAMALAQAGAHVIVAARSSGEIEAVRDDIIVDGGSAEAMHLDVSDYEALPARIEALGPMDILVNNAGLNRPNSIPDVTLEDYDAVLNLNLKAAFFVAKAVAASMIKHGLKGSLIHMSSQLGHIGWEGRTLYCASKWGLEGFNKALALDLAPHGIRSNTLCPTVIETELTKPILEDKTLLASVLARIKLGRLGRVEDLMGAVVFLSSDASAFMTGSSLVIDGGWTAA